MLAVLAKWLFFRALIRLTPIGVNALLVQTRGQPLSTAAVIGHGELLLLATALGSAGIAELVGSGQAYLATKMVVNGCCVVVLMTSTLYFGHVAAAVIANDPSVQVAMVAQLSMWLYGFAFLTSGCCVALARLQSEGTGTRRLR